MLQLVTWEVIKVHSPIVWGVFYRQSRLDILAGAGHACGPGG